MKWWMWTTAVVTGVVLLSRAFSAELPSVVILEIGSSIAVITAVIAVRKSPGDKQEWNLVVAGLVCWWIGDLTFDFIRLRQGELPTTQCTKRSAPGAIGSRRALGNAPDLPLPTV